MGLTQRKRRQVRKHQRTLRTCGECPLTLLCYTGRVPAYTSICRCNVCGLMYALDSSGRRVALFKPFRCTQAVTPLPTAQVQLLSGLAVLSVTACARCVAERLCIKCGKVCTTYDKVPGPEGHFIHYKCSAAYQHYLRLEEAARKKTKP